MMANLMLVALRMAVEAGLPVEDTTWAMRWEVDEDGTARCHPLMPSNLEAWVAARWEETA